MNCQIDRMAQGGRGITRIDGKIAFVDGALPGETVEFEFTKRKKDFDEGICTQVVQAHTQRVSPPCPLYGKCGGCNLQHASIDLQRQLKKQVVQDLFRRMAKVNLPEDWPLHGGSPWGYRHRARFVRGARGWGFRQASSHDILPISACPVLCKDINDSIVTLPKLPHGTELQVFVDSNHQLSYWHDGMDASKLAPQQVRILERNIQTDSKVFFQSNLELSPVLVNSVLQQIPKEGKRQLAVDLFSGVGVFAAFLQDHFEQVIAAEWNEGCLKHAKNNLGPNCTFHSSSAEDYLRNQNPGQIDFLVVDPPRAGLSPEVRAALIQAHPHRIAYVSCDPVTLARDVAEFLRNGFQMEKVEAFDFYPQTDHLEMLVTLV